MAWLCGCSKDMLLAVPAAETDWLLAAGLMVSRGLNSPSWEDA